MRKTRFALVLLSTLFVSTAHAHIDLMSPVARYTIQESGDNKACPCGKGTSNRTCSDANNRSDPNRSTDRITTLAPGSKVTLRFDEYVGHAGRYRVAIDFDGADLEDFNDNILLDVPDPSGSQGNIGQGSMWELEVTLPNVECDNCTLQLIQMMDGNTTDPVPDPVGRSSYYACADIVLSAGGGGGVDAGPDGPDAGPGGVDGGVDPDPIDGDGGGCGCQANPTAASSWLLFALLGLGLVTRRRLARAPVKTRRQR